jgi:hypothetical protein
MMTGEFLPFALRRLFPLSVAGAAIFEAAQGPLGHSDQRRLGFCWISGRNPNRRGTVLPTPPIILGGLRGA